MAPSTIATETIEQQAIMTMATREKPRDGFHRLVEDLSKVLGTCSGIDSEDVEVQQLEKLMKDYTSKDEEWSNYAFADFSRGYTRNLVDEGNGKSNLVRFYYTLHLTQAR